MTQAEKKVIQYLSEAHATEKALTRALQEQIAVTPTGKYRSALETHLRQTQRHATRVRARIDDIGGGPGLLTTTAVTVQSLAGQAVALAKTPLDLLRGSGGEEKVLKNAKDAAASEALEIATYTALEELATKVGDAQTATLAREIRRDEEKMLERILAEIPQLTDKVTAADVRGNGSYDIGRTGAGESVQDAGRSAKRAAGSASRTAKKTARTARKVPGVARVEGEIKGAVASADDLAIPRYDSLTADEITARLPELSQIELSKVHAYEKRGQDRSTVLQRIDTLRGREPWPGYDELTVREIRGTLETANAGTLRSVREYERAHKNRTGVIEALDASQTIA